jgi:ClpP class serine protease
LDFVRRKYLKEFSDSTGRNVIAYYSGWLQKPGSGNAEVSEDDKNGFMATIHNLDRGKGLDLFLHTPGGSIAATESLVDYLRKMFGTDIRAIIPQLAMSAGTMIACACESIIMGKQSSIGPIDPQFGGIPCHGVLSEFRRAIEEVKKDPDAIPIWQVIVSKYHPTFLGDCDNAIRWSSEIVKAWLETGMLKKDQKRTQIADRIVASLNNHDDTRTHSRHLPAEEAKRLGLKILSIEDDFDGGFQDLLLTIHHAYMHTFSQSSAIKIVENHNGIAVVTHLKA